MVNNFSQIGYLEEANRMPLNTTAAHVIETDSCTSENY